jgi:hypothetical protein
VIFLSNNVDTDGAAVIRVCPRSSHTVGIKNDRCHSDLIMRLRTR